MVNTNLLLSIAFGILSNFSEIVEVPHGAVPAAPEDLRKLVVGGPYPHTPADVFMVHKRGSEFWIENGALSRFATPGSFRGLQDPRKLTNFYGVATMTSNEVVQFATRAVQRLVKNGNPLTNGPPLVQLARASPNQEVPFYNVSWPTKSTRKYLRYSAFLEIDARKKLITFMDLRDDEFHDPAFARRIVEMVSSPSPHDTPRLPPTKSPPSSRFLLPQTNAVITAIGSWLKFCEALRLPCGTQTNLESVDWDKTCLYTNAALYPTKLVCRVWLKNGAWFDSIDGTPVTYVTPDAKLIGAWSDQPREEIPNLDGKVSQEWKVLAMRLDQLLSSRLGIPRDLADGFSPVLSGPEPTVGTVGQIRVIVHWRTWPGKKPSAHHPTPRSALAVEFDLSDGSLKWIEFFEPDFISALQKRIGEIPKQQQTKPDE